MCFFMVIFDVYEPFQFYFQDTASNLMEKIVEFHTELIGLLETIICFVIVLIFKIIKRFKEKNMLSCRFSFQHNTKIEQIWTIAPAFILWIMAFPSSSLLYFYDELFDPIITLRVTGFQWYWNYQYTEIYGNKYDSYLILEQDLCPGSYRLLEVDNRVIIPCFIQFRILVSSADVIHSWAIPSLGIKVDAIPGRINQAYLFILRTGVFYGQCSELCGVNHAFMPIVLTSEKPASFIISLFKK